MTSRATPSLNKIRSYGSRVLTEPQPKRNPLFDHNDQWLPKARESLVVGNLTREFDRSTRQHVFSDRIESMARIAGPHRKLAPFSTGRYQDTFGDEEAYEVAACVHKYRRLNFPSHTLLGRKIGFTNTKIWEKYNVTKSNWGYVTRASCGSTVDGANIGLRAMAFRPKIEPEIIFFLKHRPRASMTDRELLRCIASAAYGFEIVHSKYQGWQFTLPDTTAVDALHRSLHIGRVTDAWQWEGREDEFLQQLRTFQIELSCKPVDPNSKWELYATGSGSNVLGSPINALRHLCQILEDQSVHPQLQEGERISTGTLTDALDIEEDAQWTATAWGLDIMQNPGPQMDITIGKHGRISSSVSKSEEDTQVNPMEPELQEHYRQG